jgi:predicted HTH transcriptional regulator
MSRKPSEIYATNDWGFLVQPNIEGQWFERKAHPPAHPPKGLRDFVQERIARTICACANSNPDVGGLLVIGAGDNGELYGIDRHGTHYVNTLLSYADCLDGPTPEHKLVDCTREDGSPDHLIFIHTPFLPQRVARTTDGRCYVRRGDNTVALRPEEAQELAYRKGELHFEDETATLFDAQDLEPGMVTEFTAQYAQQKRLGDIPGIGQALRLARLTTQRDGQPWLTKGGLLVFDKHPRRLIPGAYVRYFRYEGRDDQAILLRDEQFEGPIPTIIQKLREFLPTQLARFSYRRAGVLTAEDEYPTAAWDEALVNALVHRSYSQQTRPIWIRHFDDRLEVVSPGSYPLGVTPDNLIHTPRNTNLMAALRYLNFVRMAEEGIKRMRAAMRSAGLPPPRFSPPELDRVTCTLLNNIDERIKARSDLATQARITPTTVLPNIYPLRMSSSLTVDPHAPFAEEAGRPTFSAVRMALHTALRAAGFRIESFAGVTAVDFTQEYIVPALTASKIAAIYPGIAFRLLELEGFFYLVLDHTVEVRNRAPVHRVRRALPWLRLANHRRCFVRCHTGWQPGYIIEAMNGSYRVELKQEGHTPPEVIEADGDSVIPDLHTNFELPALLEAEGIQVHLTHEVRKASLVAVEDAPHRRLERVHQIAQTLATRVFPLAIGSHELQLATAPAEINQPPFFMGQKLRDPKAQFDNQGLRQDEDILRGLTTFGAFQKPAQEIPLVVVCPAVWASQMQAFIGRLRQGSQRYRGMEATFGIRFGTITTVIAEPLEYETRVREAIAQLPPDAQPAFLVFAPERGFSRANYDSPYYRLKRLLLEAGYPSQMLKEDTLEHPEWKDYNFALDVFAKAGFVPWVLGEGMPSADLFIGLSSSIMTHKGQRQRVIGYANVFDDFGRWLFYQGASASVPYEHRNTMFASLLGEITRDYHARRRKLQWVHIHHSAKLRREDRNEIARGILHAAPDAEVSFVHVNEHNAFRLFDTSPRGDGVAARGTWVMLSPNQFVLATTGPNPIGQKDLGTPRPLEIGVHRIHAHGKLDLAIYAQHVLGLTRLNWASTRAFCHAPITTKFAQDIAYLMNVFLATGADFRLHDRLRHTPWFL